MNSRNTTLMDGPWMRDLRGVMTQSGSVVFIVAVMGIFLATVTFFSLGRHWFSYGTETDFLGAFLPDAVRFQSGQAMQVAFHPPLYSLVIATVHRVVGDWLQTGILVSILSSGGCLMLTWLLVERCLGPAAGSASVIALVLSGTYMTYSGLATSDLLFALFYTAALYAGMRAFQQESATAWLVCGLICACAILTRSNGIILLLLALLPFVDSQHARVFPSARGVYLAGFYLAGLALPLLAWGLYAQETGAPFAPAGNAANIALTYFGDGADRISGDARIVIESRFHSLQEVLSHDPLTMARTYFSDLLHVRPLRSFDLFVPGSIILYIGSFLLLHARKRLSDSWYFLLAITLLHVLLINLKTFEPRYYLFILPVVAAPAGVVVADYFRAMSKPGYRWTMAGLITLLVCASAVANTRDSVSRFHESDRELRSASTAIQEFLRTQPERVYQLYARKPHLAFYLGLDSEFLPSYATLAELDAFLRQQAGTGPRYIFFGEIERQSRPQYAGLLAGVEGFDAVLSWPADVDPEDAEWVLFRQDGADR